MRVLVLQHIAIEHTLRQRFADFRVDNLNSDDKVTVVAFADKAQVLASSDGVLDKGAIVERGTHAQLLAAHGLYASMWNRQREAEEAREKLARVAEDGSAPNRNPPPVEEVAAVAAPNPPTDAPVEAAE